jgi:hypothetical protein
MNQKKRTIILVCLLILGISFIFYISKENQTNFIDSF